MIRELTISNFLFPDTHFVVYQAVPLEVVTQSDKIVSHSLEKLFLKQCLGRMLVQVVHHLKCHIFLLLQHSQPAVVKAVPELQSLILEILLILRQS